MHDVAIRLDEVARRLGRDPERLSLKRLARGVTHETLIVEEADLGPVAVLRLEPPRREILPRHTPSEEGILLQAIAGRGIPVPEVLANDEDGDRLGRPGVLLSYVSGRSTMTWEELRERGGKGADDHALEVLRRLHAVRPPQCWPDVDAAAEHARRDLDRARRLGAAAGSARPIPLDEALNSLAAAPPEISGLPCCVHGDYRPANLMVWDGAVTGVLDWEMTTAGDPACDFGVATMAPWGCWWPDEELLDRYRAAGGPAIRLDSLLWWRCLGYAKVVAFLARRAADGWPGGPRLEPWVDGLRDSLAAWRRAAT